MQAITVQATDSHKRIRPLAIKGMIKPSGMRCGRITNDRGETYTTQIRTDGSGTCTCDSHKPCYHMDALLQADLPTFEELTACEEPVSLCASAAPEKREQAPCKEPAFPSRKALITKLEAMNPAQVLFPAWKRDPRHRGYAVEQSLKQFFGDVSFGQATHCVGLGSLKKNPKWFVQLYVDLAYDNKDITPGYILYFLNWKPAKKSKQPKQSAPSLTERMESAPLTNNRGFSLLKVG